MSTAEATFSKKRHGEPSLATRNGADVRKEGLERSKTKRMQKNGTGNGWDGRVVALEAVVW